MKKITALLLALRVLLLVVLCCPCILAQQDNSGPSLPETMDWIKGKLLDYSRTQNCSLTKSEVKITSVSINGSVLEWTEKSTSTGMANCNVCTDSVSTFRHTLNFSEIDPNSITVTEGQACDLHFYTVYGETSSGRKTIRTETANAPAQLESRFDIYTNGEDAKRLANAIKHAVILSGGKPGLFR